MILGSVSSCKVLEMIYHLFCCSVGTYMYFELCIVNKAIETV